MESCKLGEYKKQEWLAYWVTEIEISNNIEILTG